MGKGSDSSSQAQMIEVVALKKIEYSISKKLIFQNIEEVAMESKTTKKKIGIIEKLKYLLVKFIIVVCLSFGYGDGFSLSA